MTSIQETVGQSLTAAGLGGYSTQAAPVIEALVNREREITESLIQAATEQGVNRDDAVRIFEGLGLAMPNPPAQAAQTEGLPQAVQDRLNALEAFARANGFRG